MINLLPAAQKKEIRAGRINLTLTRYIFASAILAALLFIFIVVVHNLLIDAKASAQQSVDEINKQTDQYQYLKHRVDSFNSNLSIAKTILSKDVSYSKVAVKIAQALPPNLALESLQLSADAFGHPITLSTTADKYEDAIALKKTLEQSPVFQDVHLQSVSKSGGDKGRISISISVTINPNIVNL